jgi:hypothetical protein
MYIYIYMCVCVCVCMYPRFQTEKLPKSYEYISFNKIRSPKMHVNYNEMIFLAENANVMNIYSR